MQTLVNPNQGKSKPNDKAILLLDNDKVQHQHQEVLLKIREDGSFRQCDEGCQEGKWISGRWKLVLEQEESQPENESPAPKLLIAMDRQYFGPAHDSFLRGEFENEESDTKKIEDNRKALGTTLSVSGTVATGKFTNPKKHPSFFEEPILTSPELTGKFRLMQMLSFLTMTQEEKIEKDDASQQRFQ